MRAYRLGLCDPGLAVPLPGAPPRLNPKVIPARRGVAASIFSSSTEPGAACEPEVFIGKGSAISQAFTSSFSSRPPRRSLAWINQPAFQPLVAVDLICSGDLKIGLLHLLCNFTHSRHSIEHCYKTGLVVILKATSHQAPAVYAQTPGIMAWSVTLELSLGDPFSV